MLRVSFTTGHEARVREGRAHKQNPTVQEPITFTRRRRTGRPPRPLVCTRRGRVSRPRVYTQDCSCLLLIPPAFRLNPPCPRRVFLSRN